jgi:uroporphyrinogen decarboxylase
VSENDTPRFLKALKREPVDRPPVWFMRQAGRYLPEYREVRANREFLEVCKTPELACEVTLQPIRRYGFDASIVFSDILTVPEAMGQTLTFGKGMGPRLDAPVRTADDVKKLAVFDPTDKTRYVADAVELIVKELPADVPLIGFCGSPFTVACYMVEGQGSKHFLEIKQMMYGAPDVFTELLDKLVACSIDYLRMQVEAGCRALQIFDTWAGELSPGDLRRFAVEPARRIIEGVKDLGVPTIYFARGCADALDIVRHAGADAYGLDWRARIGKSWDALGHDVAVQGNLDPASLFAPPEVVKEKTRDVLEDAGTRPGYIFNLGHGILPKTPLESVEAVLEVVHEAGAR